MRTIDLSENGPIWNAAKELYSVGKRAYHTFDHALDVLERVNCAHNDIGFMNIQAARLAALFHDAVYDTTNLPAENEEQSALAMQKVVQAHWGVWTIGEEMDAIRPATLLIRATAQHMSPQSTYTDWDTVLFLDCDVLGFAEQWDQFKKQNEDIAYEYNIVDPEAYKQGRIRFLSALYNKGVFRSPYFKMTYEALAKQNIARSLQELGVKFDDRMNIVRETVPA